MIQKHPSIRIVMPQKTKNRMNHSIRKIKTSKKRQENPMMNLMTTRHQKMIDHRHEHNPEHIGHLSRKIQHEIYERLEMNSAEGR